MLERYSRSEMRALWSEKNRLNVWLEVEILTTEAWAKLGVIPQADAEKIRKQASFSIERMHEIEAETKHDVVAFTRAVGESLGDEKKWIHYGLTSTDVVDTAYGYLFKQVNTLLEQDIVEFVAVLKKQALVYKDTIMIGRTHGIHAEPTTLGLKFALWYAEMQRNLERFHLARQQIEVGKISGAVGTFAHTKPEVEEYVCEHLGIGHALISTQTLQRDRHAFYVATLSLIATSLEKMATEIRHLQRSEVREVEEFFAQGQKGSSAMPHKRNPIGSENIVGCARVMRGYMLSAYEDVPLWHERDISHSAVERIIMPDATQLLDYMLQRFGKILDTLVVYPETMQENMNCMYGLIFSQQVLLALIDKGWSREKAYDVVQPLAMKAWETKTTYRTLIENDEAIAQVLTSAEIAACFDTSALTQDVDSIYQRLNLG